MRVAGSGVDAWAGGRVASLVDASQFSGRLFRKSPGLLPAIEQRLDAGLHLLLSGLSRC